MSKSVHICKAWGWLKSSEASLMRIKQHSCRLWRSVLHSPNLPLMHNDCQWCCSLHWLTVTAFGQLCRCSSAGICSALQPWPIWKWRCHLAGYPALWWASPINPQSDIRLCSSSDALLATVILRLWASMSDELHRATRSAVHMWTIYTNLWSSRYCAELFFYIFLPPLLLDAAVRIDFYLFKKVSKIRSLQKLLNKFQDLIASAVKLSRRSTLKSVCTTS